MPMIADRKRGVRAASMNTTSGSMSTPPMPAKKGTTPLESAKSPKKRFARAVSSKSTSTPAKTKKKR
jgi:hypothetical protein